MTLPQILVNLMKLLFDMAVPVPSAQWSRRNGVATGGRREFRDRRSISTMGIVVGHHAYSPQFLSWFAAQGISMPPQGGNISSPWVNSVETSFTGFISNVVVARLIPVLAAFAF